MVVYYIDDLFVLILVGSTKKIDKFVAIESHDDLSPRLLHHKHT